MWSLLEKNNKSVKNKQEEDLGHDLTIVSYDEEDNIPGGDDNDPLYLYPSQSKLVVEYYYKGNIISEQKKDEILLEQLKISERLQFINDLMNINKISKFDLERISEGLRSISYKELSRQNKEVYDKLNTNYNEVKEMMQGLQELKEENKGLKDQLEGLSEMMSNIFEKVLEEFDKARSDRDKKHKELSENLEQVKITVKKLRLSADESFKRAAEERKKLHSETVGELFKTHEQLDIARREVNKKFEEARIHRSEIYQKTQKELLGCRQKIEESIRQSKKEFENASEEREKYFKNQHKKLNELKQTQENIQKKMLKEFNQAKEERRSYAKLQSEVITKLSKKQREGFNQVIEDRRKAQEKIENVIEKSRKRAEEIYKKTLDEREEHYKKIALKLNKVESQVLQSREAVDLKLTKALSKIEEIEQKVTVSIEQEEQYKKSMEGLNLIEIELLESRRKYEEFEKIKVERDKVYQDTAETLDKANNLARRENRKLDIKVKKAKESMDKVYKETLKSISDGGLNNEIREKITKVQDEIQDCKQKIRQVEHKKNITDQLIDTDQHEVIMGIKNTKNSTIIQKRQKNIIKHKITESYNEYIKTTNNSKEEALKHIDEAIKIAVGLAPNYIPLTNYDFAIEPVSKKQSDPLGIKILLKQKNNLEKELKIKQIELQINEASIVLNGCLEILKAQSKIEEGILEKEKIIAIDPVSKVAGDEIKKILDQIKKSIALGWELEEKEREEEASQKFFEAKAQIDELRVIVTAKLEGDKIFQNALTMQLDAQETYKSSKESSNTELEKQALDKYNKALELYGIAQQEYSKGVQYDSRLENFISICDEGITGIKNLLIAHEPLYLGQIDNIRGYDNDSVSYFNVEQFSQNIQSSFSILGDDSKTYED